MQGRGRGNVAAERLCGVLFVGLTTLKRIFLHQSGRNPKELEEWFDAQKEMRGIAKLDPYFERTSRLASRRLKREIQRRGTLGEFALEPDPSLKRIPTEESGSDLFRSDGPDAAALSYRVESP